MTVPDLDKLTPEQIGELIQLARPVRGEEIRITWSEIIITRDASGDLPPHPPRSSASCSPAMSR
ncbi:hypothetical protein [Nonomuraea sp. NPDC049400]|uniref:hypothetical protein n=1 Tax=Nonomuraea sp. NPDC049400 TaxID=3364352 RepID=UPI0037BAD916